VFVHTRAPTGHQFSGPNPSDAARARQDPALRPTRFHYPFGTRMAATGGPIRTLHAWMGHVAMKTTMIYIHYAPTRRGGARQPRVR
jgi:integrase